MHVEVLYIEYSKAAKVDGIALARCDAWLLAVQISIVLVLLMKDYFTTH